MGIAKMLRKREEESARNSATEIGSIKVRRNGLGQGPREKGELECRFIDERAGQMGSSMED
jgi:hypothetical protein